MDDSITKRNDRPDRLFKAIVAICLIFIAMACTVYSSDTYKRRAHEQKAWDYCAEIMSEMYKEADWPKEYAGRKVAGLREPLKWTAINKCAKTGDLN